MLRESVSDVKGLHHKEMQRLVNQLQYMDEHAKELISVLNCQLEITYASAPKRVRTYLLDRSERRNPVRQQRERLPGSKLPIRAVGRGRYLRRSGPL